MYRHKRAGSFKFLYKGNYVSDGFWGKTVEMSAGRTKNAKRRNKRKTEEIGVYRS
jgi:hypothetical protein